MLDCNSARAACPEWNYGDGVDGARTITVIPTVIRGMAARIEAAGPSPRILARRNAEPLGDRADAPLALLCYFGFRYVANKIVERLVKKMTAEALRKQHGKISN